MGDYSRLEYRRAGNILAVRPLLRLLGPWDGADDPRAEALEFRDQLRQLLGAEAGPLLLDLRGFESARNWNWFLIPLACACRGQGRPLAACVRPAVAEQFAVTKLDRLLLVRTEFEEAVAILSQEGGGQLNPSFASASGSEPTGDRISFHSVARRLPLSALPG